MSNSYHIIQNESSDIEKKAILYGGTIRDGGKTRSYRKVLHLDNDVSEDPDNTKQYATIQGQSTTANEITIAFWIYPMGVSSPGAGVVVNNNGNDSYGVIINSNGTENLIGYVWGDPSHNYEFDLNVQVPSDQWSYIVVIIYADGKAKLFGNNQFLGLHDTGYVRDPVEFDNIELGRFSGMLDDVRFYASALDYGNVAIGQTAEAEVSYLFHRSRITGLVDPQTLATVDENSPFYYIQNSEYVTAYQNYIINRTHSDDDLTTIPDEEFVVSGGTNDGKYALADGSFRTFPGKIVEEPVKNEEKEKVT